MKAEYINPFILASSEMIDQVTGFKTEKGKIYVKNVPYKSESILVIIGITGGFQTGDNIELCIPNTVVECIPLVFEDKSQIEINVSFAEDIS